MRAAAISVKSKELEQKQNDTTKPFDRTIPVSVLRNP